MKSGLLTVVVAPGCHVTTPHPSGIKELSAVVLNGGDTLQVDAATAEALFRARLINDPETGAPPPPLASMAPQLPTGPTISYAGGRRMPMNDFVVHQPSWAATAEAPSSSRNRAPKPPPWDCTNGGRTVGDYAGGVSVTTHAGPDDITADDGRSWPNY